MTHPVYVVRHGQSEWNVRRLTQGQTTHPALTDIGRSQATTAAGLIAADLAGLGVAAERLISSDLTRAMETAKVIGRWLELTVESDPRLREQHLGELEGRSYEETWAAAETFDWSDPTQPIAGGESLMDVYERMAAVLEEVDPTSVTVLVSHGDAIRAMIAYLNGAKPHKSNWIDVPNGAVARVDGAITWLGTAPIRQPHAVPGQDLLMPRGNMITLAPPSFTGVTLAGTDQAMPT
ncbi:histidine phosphatase family protein [Nocardioides immobilis]|uniref:histidine phosphatase family protein n=1 Tax=Nocardioides immobilis TaxID=2049295 RepID=UPI0015F85284|nr:histidine phosphatase family protein [Nocardioides immobilis]